MGNNPQTQANQERSNPIWLTLTEKYSVNYFWLGIILIKRILIHSKMNPLELFLYITFLLYSLLYKPKLFLIYVLLLIIYTFITQVLMHPPPQTFNQKIMAAAWKHPSEGPIRVSQELEVGKAFEYIQKLSIQSGTHVTLTHLVIRALALGLAKFPEIQGHLKFGNFDKVDKFGMVCVTNVDQGNDLVPVEFHDFVEMSVEDIAKQCNEKVYRARRGKDQIHKKRTNPNKYIPTFLMHFLVIIMSYVVFNMGLPMKPSFKGRDFGQCAFSNVGVFGMKKGFAPLCIASGGCLFIAMGKAFKKPVVQNGEIVIRQKMLFNYTCDHRHGDGGKAIKCITTIYEYLKDPEQYEKNLRA